ncbi:MAG: hypothetical protein U0800_14050 [Isosphaeraceae bacterium]
MPVGPVICKGNQPVMSRPGAGQPLSSPRALSRPAIINTLKVVP